jgi:hypothetical protein
VNGQGGISILVIPVIITTAQTAHQFDILGTDGIIMGVREQLNIRFFFEDGANIRENMCTIRADILA